MASTLSLKAIKEKNLNISDLDSLLVNSEGFSQLFVQRTSKKWINYVINRVSKSSLHLSNLVRILSDFVVSNRHPEWIRHALFWLRAIQKKLPNLFAVNSKVKVYMKNMSYYHTEVKCLNTLYDHSATRGELKLRKAASKKDINVYSSEVFFKFNNVYIDDSDDDFGDVEVKKKRLRLAYLHRLHEKKVIESVEKQKKAALKKTDRKKSLANVDKSSLRRKQDSSKKSLSSKPKKFAKDADVKVNETEDESMDEEVEADSDGSNKSGLFDDEASEDDDDGETEESNDESDEEEIGLLGDCDLDECEEQDEAELDDMQNEDYESEDDVDESDGDEEESVDDGVFDVDSDGEEMDDNEDIDDSEDENDASADEASDGPNEDDVSRHQQMGKRKKRVLSSSGEESDDNRETEKSRPKRRDRKSVDKDALELDNLEKMQEDAQSSDEAASDEDEAELEMLMWARNSDEDTGDSDDAKDEIENDDKPKNRREVIKQEKNSDAVETKTRKSSRTVKKKK